MKKTILVIGPLDTKGPENLYLKQKIEEDGCEALVMDIRTIGEAAFVPDITCDEVAAAAGTSIDALLAAHDRMACIEAMGNGAAELAYRLYQAGRIHGVISMGGAQTTSMAAAVMRKMPIGFPKVIVSTLATSAHDQVMLAGINDTFVINPLTDVAGLSCILSTIIERAAGAITGMVRALPEGAPPALSMEGQKPCVGISMWGVTTKCVLRVAEILEKHGYQALVFHATGIGGHTMERLIEQGVIRAVAEITLAEFANPLVGGEHDYDPLRLTSAAKAGIPQIVVPGGCDMVKHMTRDGFVPEQYRKQKYYLHNPSLLFTRSTQEDNRKIGRALAEKLNASRGYVEVLFPEKGLSAYDIEGGPLYEPSCDEALAEAIETGLRKDIRFERCGSHINDSGFAQKIAAHLLESIEKEIKQNDSMEVNNGSEN